MNNVCVCVCVPLPYLYQTFSCRRYPTLIQVASSYMYM
jgi:hypothetical protein